MSEQQFIIRKGGYYYRPNAQGYTSSLLEAGRYSEAEAVAHMEHCDPGEITIFPAPAVPASPTLPQDIAATAERIVLEHIAASLDIDGTSAGSRFDMLAVAIAAALEIERSAQPATDHLVAADKVERAAQAMWFDYVDQQGYPNGLPTWDEMSGLGRGDRREEFRSMARAALAKLEDQP